MATKPTTKQLPTSAKKEGAGEKLIVAFPDDGHFPFVLPAFEKMMAENKLNIEIVTFTEANMLTNLKKANVAVPLQTAFPAEFFNKYDGQLKYILQFGTGTDRIDKTAAKAKSITVCNIPTEGSGNAESTAEQAMTLLMCAMGNIKGQMEAFNNSVIGAPMRKSIKNSTITLFGFGGVGTEIFKRLLGFEPARIFIVKNSEPGNKTIFEKEIVGATKLFGVEYHFITQTNKKNEENKQFTAQRNEALFNSDAIILALEYKKELENMVNRDFLTHMKEGSVIVNMGRGKLVNNPDLCEAIEANHIKFYASDVGCSLNKGKPNDPVEPFPPKDPLAADHYNNTLFTPHVGGISTDRYEKNMPMFIEQFELILQGKEPKHKVNA